MRSGLGLVSISLAVLSTATLASAAPAPPAQNVLQQYCVGCHNQRVKTAGLALDTLDPANVAANAEVWERVLRKLQLGRDAAQGDDDDTGTYMS